MIYDSSNDNHWQFVEATCNGTSASYIDTHVFNLYQPSSTTIKYECILCGKQFNTPEYDDRNILDDADYMTVFTLQQTYYYELSKGDYLKAEGCLKAIDEIRKQTRYVSNSVSLYQYRDSSGNYKSPNLYEYTTIQNGLEYTPVRIEISVNKITTSGFLLNALFSSLIKNVAEIVLEPFDKLSDIYSDTVLISDVVSYIGDKEEYTLAEVRGTVIDWVADKAIGALESVPGKVGKVASKASKIILIAGILYDTYHIARDATRLPGNYAIGVDVYTTSGVDQFIGDYGYKYTNGSTAVNKHQKNVINEYFEPWDNGIYDPISPPTYNYCNISYIGVQDSSGNDKPSITLRLKG